MPIFVDKTPGKSNLSQPLAIAQYEAGIRCARMTQRDARLAHEKSIDGCSARPDTGAAAFFAPSAATFTAWLLLTVSPGQIIGDKQNLLVSQIRTFLLHASDCHRPRVLVRLLVIDAIERVARGADVVHEGCNSSIGTGCCGSATSPASPAATLRS